MIESERGARTGASLKTKHNNKGARMYLSDFLREGAAMTMPLELYRAHAKAIGHMYSAKVQLKLNGHKFDFEMWHHFSSPPDLSQVQSEMCLRHIDGKSVSWTAVLGRFEVWVREEDWFPCDEFLPEHMRDYNPNYQRLTLTDEDRLWLLTNNFQRVASVMWNR